ncbi:CheR family methyltransferase [Marinagarivorans cellulosilyticus]|uniref:protein-glutamate O-methyltransferase n=1 Tax=Marinagarivorans cellulosilyticus TaxID=2721545 RepID=A0AAN1WI26_9GAMM|nr:CheR family methyltransferase [Marinagarivorans cellulosilyticus]BCD98016.1 type IV pilus assembly protein PilK [Marinagarivorans cellulosilyticus]
MVWSLQSLPELNDIEFERWGKLLEERAGIYMGDQQRVFLQTQVAMRMRELDFDSYSKYLDFVLDGVSGMLEWTRLIDRLVVKETSFFRHKESIDMVAQHLAKRLVDSHDSESFELWSVGCSSGEEPYSLAMVLNDAYKWVNKDPLYGITATDISRAALSLARTGIYNERKLERLDQNYRQRYFTTLDDGKYQVISSLRDRICFNQGNVLNISEMPVVKVDAIYCQNLLIYFKRWLRENIMNAFVERLKPGGILVIGLGEVVDWSHPKMKRISTEEVQAYVHI